MTVLDVKGSGAERAPGSEKQRGWGEEDDGRNSYKKKKSRREKLRREALNDQFMLLSALLDPNEAGPLTTDRATIVTKAAVVIKRLREELSATLETLQNHCHCTERDEPFWPVCRGQGCAAAGEGGARAPVSLLHEHHAICVPTTWRGVCGDAHVLAAIGSGACDRRWISLPKQPEGWVMPDISSLP